MKRYRVVAFDLDTRATILAMDVPDSWEPTVRAAMRENQEGVARDLVETFGARDATRKRDDFVAMGPAPISVLAYHNKFLREARDSFALGSYYPALTAICALGERVLNQLVVAVREDFPPSAERRAIHQKKSFQDWDLVSSTLRDWEIISSEVAEWFGELRSLRHHSLHFNVETEMETRARALRAIELFQNVVANQFSAWGTQPWFVPNDQGISLIKKAYENNVFVKRVMLPSCALVGPRHQLISSPGGLIVVDENDYDGTDISDEEYVELYRTSPH